MPTWGRGGAGNIVSNEQVKEQERRIAEDLEANRTLTSSAAPPAASSLSPSQSQEYAHMGRGGAGNWYQPTELESSGQFSNQSSNPTKAPSGGKPQVSTPWHPEGQELPVARAGRGGAGNFVWRDEESRRNDEEERAEKERRLEEGVKRDVERGVEVELQMPGKAMLGGVKAGRGW